MVLALAVCALLVGMFPQKPVELLQIGRVHLPEVARTMNPEMLLLSALALPVAMLLACLVRGPEEDHAEVDFGLLLFLRWLPRLFGTRNSPVVLSGEPYHVTLMLDASGSMLLTAASLLWIAAGFYAPAFFRGRAMTGSFTVCWLFTLIGSLGIFLAADLVSFFLFYALVSLPAYGLVTYDGTPVARRAGAIYMGFALLGENLLLMGFVLLAANTPDGSLRIADAVDALQAAPSRNCDPFAVDSRLRNENRSPADAFLDAAELHGVADSRRRCSQWCRCQGRCHRAHSISALRHGASGLGRIADHRGPLRSVLRRCRGHHSIQPENRAGLFQRKPDGVSGGGARNGTFGGRRRALLLSRLFMPPTTSW